MMEKKKVKPVILYVDDERYNLTTFTSTFRKRYTIFSALSGKDAIEILKKENIDIIITDQRMPEMTGLQFLEAVLHEFPSPVRMILTGFSDIEAITNAINNGSVLRYITKPWNEDELKQIIEMGVRYHDLEEDQRRLKKNLENELAAQTKTIDTFKKYVPEHIYAQAMNPSTSQTLSSGEFRIISVLFSDIRQFTKLSETLDPKALVYYINKYFTIMIDCVIKNHGYVYKLLGDGLLATFGAPISSFYNQHNAVLCAQDMIRQLKIFNDTMLSEINHEAKIGIGIATGESTVGHIVSENFLSYVAIGEVVEKAALLEELTHSTPNTILIDEATYKEIKDKIKAEHNGKDMFFGTEESIYKVVL